MLDCFWAGLPVVTTRGDSLSELVAEHDLGRVVDFEDVDGWVSAIEALLDDDDARTTASRNAAEVREELAWPRVVATLARLVAVPGSRTSRSPRLRLAVLEYLRVRAQLSMLRRGPLGTAHRIARRLTEAASFRR
jgi:glycosyl transferase family 1